MALPLLNTPEFETTIPSNKQRIKFRPFLVKEEKILFMALQGNDPNEMTNAVKNILNACVLSDGFEVDSLSIFDVEYLFMQLRGKSVGETVDLKVKHPNSDCDHVTDVELNIDDINVSFPEQYSDKIELTEDVGIQLRHPGINQTTIVDSDDDDFTKIMNLITECVVCIYDSNNVYDTFTNEEIKQFIENLNQEQFKKIRDFFNNTPTLSHDIVWTCPKCNQEDSVNIRGLTSFFT